MAKDFDSAVRITTCSVAGAATQVVSGSACLKKIIINVSTAVTVGLVDNTTGSTVTYGTIAKSPGVQDIDFGRLSFAKGIRIITTGAATINPDITVIYNQ